MNESMMLQSVIHGLDENREPGIGPAVFRSYYERMLATLSDIHFDLHEIVESGSMAATRWTVRVTHSGAGFGIQPTGKVIQFTGMTMVRMEDGLVAEGWNEWNRVPLVTTVGILAPTC